MRKCFCLLTLLILANTALCESFKIDSFYYIDSAPKPNEDGSKVVFTVDRDVTCDGVTTNNIFIDNVLKQVAGLFAH